MTLIRRTPEEPWRRTDMLLRDNEVMLCGCRASIFKHNIVTILEINGISIADSRARRVDVEGRVRPRRILERYLEDDIEIGIVLGHLAERAFFLRKAPHLQNASKHVSTGEDEDKRVEKRGTERTTGLG
jgi:hypothetical protein